MTIIITITITMTPSSHLLTYVHALHIDLFSFRFQRAYKDLCPGDWVEKWDEQRDEGTWPGKY